MQNGELGVLELHSRGAEVGVVLVLTLKLLVERVVISTRKTAWELIEERVRVVEGS